MCTLTLGFTGTEQDFQEEAQRKREQNLLPLQQLLAISKGGRSAITNYAATIGRTRAFATAMLLYSLGKRLERTAPGERNPDVQAALDILTSELTVPSQISDNTPTSLLDQLNPKELALASWASSQLYGKADVAQLCTALLQHVLHSKAYLHFKWLDWSQVLYGVTLSGVTCAASKPLQALYTEAASLLTPRLAEEEQQRSSQSISNIMYAAAKAGARRRDWEQYAAAVAVAHEAGIAMSKGTTQDWSNLLWACNALEIYHPGLIVTATRAIQEQSEHATAQDLSNTLYAASGLGWYEPVVYDMLMATFNDKIKAATTQEICNALYACYIVRHNSDVVQQVAAAALADSQRRQWVAQDIANTLLACSLLQGSAGSNGQLEYAPASKLSRALFNLASRFNPRLFNFEHLSQVYRAHRSAEASGLPGLAADSHTWAAASRHWNHHTQILLKQEPMPVLKEAYSAAVATGRYRVAVTSLKLGWLVRTAACTARVQRSCDHPVQGQVPCTSHGKAGGQRAVVAGCIRSQLCSCRGGV
jgi:hypothetical protein